MTRRKAAWDYACPTGWFEGIAGLLPIYPGMLEAAWVEDLPVTPQPGIFYGGWVMENLNGTVKGGLGTLGW